MQRHGVLEYRWSEEGMAGGGSSRCRLPEPEQSEEVLLGKWGFGGNGRLVAFRY